MAGKSNFRLRAEKLDLGIVWLADTTERTAPMCAWTRRMEEGVLLSKAEAEEEREVLAGLGVKVTVMTMGGRVAR